MREASGDALGQIAEGLYLQHSPVATGDPSSNPVLRAAVETVAEQKKEAQQAGAYALLQARSPEILAYTSPQHSKGLHLTTQYSEGLRLITLTSTACDMPFTTLVMRLKYIGMVHLACCTWHAAFGMLRLACCA